jgi:hypothetical protein
MLDFVKLCKDYNIPCDTEGSSHHYHEGWAQTHCPFCTDGNNGWHLGFSLTGGHLNCWRCGSHSAYDFLLAIFKSQRISIKNLFRQYSIKSIATKIKEKERRKKVKQPPSLYPLTKKYLKKLKKKKFDLKSLINNWDLSMTKGLSGEWNWRIIVPIKDSENNIVAYTGRAIDPDKKPRWLNSKNEDMAIDPKKLIYGIEKIVNRVLIVEGPSDVWRMGPGAVGLFGIDWKVEQASILKDFYYRFIMFDPEKEAQKQAEKLAKWLAPFPGETEIITGMKTDPGDLSQVEADNIMKELGF